MLRVTSGVRSEFLACLCRALAFATANLLPVFLAASRVGDSSPPENYENMETHKARLMSRIFRVSTFTCSARPIDSICHLFYEFGAVGVAHHVRLEQSPFRIGEKFGLQQSSTRLKHTPVLLKSRSLHTFSDHHCRPPIPVELLQAFVMWMTTQRFYGEEYLSLGHDMLLLLSTVSQLLMWVALLLTWASNPG